MRRMLGRRMRSILQATPSIRDSTLHTKGDSVNHTAINKRLSNKGGALITRKALRDMKSLNPVRRFNAYRHLKGVR